MNYLLDTTWGLGNFMPTQEELNKIRAQIVASDDDEDEFVIFTRAVRNYYGLHITGVEQ
jgi:hypothetical protein